MKRKDIAKLVSAVFVCELMGTIGSAFTFPSLGGWYAALNKPSFSPPNWLFGPVWTALYLLMGIALYLVIAKGIKKRKARTAVLFFSIQLALNLMWSILFFGLRSPLFGLIGISALWVSIAITILEFYGVSKAAGRLLLPYIVWVTFAALLNFYVFVLN